MAERYMFVFKEPTGRTALTPEQRAELVLPTPQRSALVLVTPAGVPGLPGTPGQQGATGQQGVPGLGVRLLEVGVTVPPAGTPIGTLIYRKT